MTVLELALVFVVMLLVLILNSCKFTQFLLFRLHHIFGVVNDFLLQVK